MKRMVDCSPLPSCQPLKASQDEARPMISGPSSLLLLALRRTVTPVFIRVAIQGCQFHRRALKVKTQVCLLAWGEDTVYDAAQRSCAEAYGSQRDILDLYRAIKC